MSKIQFAIQGISPLIMHSGVTVDPLHPMTKALGTVQSKRGKTEDDHRVLGYLEWHAGLYTTKPSKVDMETLKVSHPADSRVCIPSHLLDSNIRKGARKDKNGKGVSAGVIVLGSALLDYPGAKDINELNLDESYTYRVAVAVSMSKVMRTRPIFNEWKATFDLLVDDTVIDIDEIKKAVAKAGSLVGIGDWRPEKSGSFGRYVVSKVTVSKDD